MAGQEQVMLQLSSLLQKLNAGVDQAGPILVKQIMVERIEAAFGLLIGSLFLGLAINMVFRIHRKARANSYFDHFDDGFLYWAAAVVSFLIATLTLLFNTINAIQLTFNPMWYVISELAGK